jgi:hypothetical protein
MLDSALRFMLNWNCSSFIGIDMNKQEIFDIVATHLVTQKVKSQCGTDVASPFNSGKHVQLMCKYWDKTENRKCAIGCLIPEDKYHSLMESQGSIGSNPMVRMVLIDIGINLADEDINAFLGGLQYAHDYCEPSNWKSQLLMIAQTHDLNAPEFLKEYI